MNRFFPWRIFSRFILVQGALVLLGLGASGLAARHFFKTQFLAQVEHQLREELVIHARELSHEAAPAADWCSTRAQGTTLRLTVIERSGKVYCDSHHSPETMENHADRPEVRAALESHPGLDASGYGESVRFSATLGEEMVYGALALPSGRVLRAATPLRILARTLRVFDASLFFFLAMIAATLTLLAMLAARKLVIPIGRLLAGASGSTQDLGAAESWGEFAELETSIDSLRRQLQAGLDRLAIEREEQAALMSAISDAILAVDATGNTLFYNSRFALLFGAHEGGGREALERRKLEEFFREPAILELFRTALSRGQAGSVNAVPFATPDGRSFYALSVSPLRKDGKVYGAIGVFHDVSELKRAEQIRIDFVANVSHELRTPLTAIKGYADTMTEDARLGRPVEPKFLEVIERNTARLMSLIQDLLDLSSLESTDSLQKTLVNTRELSERILQQLQGNFASKRQDVQLDVQASQVMADPKRLEQVLVNLLDNAHKYTPVGGRISIRWETSGSDVLLKVSDTGPGIPPEHLPRLFERFYRVDKARSRELGGTGLGLAIVKHILQRHDGSIAVESVIGQGTTFTCRLPS